ncbi:MAG: hypothetical protein ABJA66_21255 [Actinomycetota bacterium]
MSGKLTLTIKDYHNGGGDLTIPIIEALTSEKKVGGVAVIKLRIVRKPDKHSSRLGMFAYIRNTQPGYQNLGFSEISLIFDRFADDGKFLSRTITVYSGVAVESSMKRGEEEEIIFTAGKKSDDLAISNIFGVP